MVPRYRSKVAPPVDQLAIAVEGEIGQGGCAVVLSHIEASERAVRRVEAPEQPLHLSWRMALLQVGTSNEKKAPTTNRRQLIEPVIESLAG